MIAFLRKHDAPFDESDFAESFARVEEPARTTYRGYTVYKQGFGSQGPVLLETLNILEQFDLHAMGYASADYLHTIVEAMKLAYADRDLYYADPGVRERARRRVALESLREGARGADRSEACVNHVYVAGDPFKYDLRSRTGLYWKASVGAGAPATARETSEPAMRELLGATSPACRRTPRTWPSWTRTGTSSTRPPAADGYPAR